MPGLRASIQVARADPAPRIPERKAQVATNHHANRGTGISDTRDRAGSDRTSSGYALPMPGTTSTAAGVAFLARPGRPAVVTRTVAELTGPTSGVVELPLRLIWCPDRSFDLADPDQLLWMYENVLREATRTDDLRRLINGALLRRVWPTLNLPHGVRRAWEARHRSLHRAV
jgi:hypothetical protein